MQCSHPRGSIGPEISDILISAMERTKAEDWYSVNHLSDGVSLISEPYIKEFYRCNVWHVRGRDANLLVDSGMGVVGLRQQVTLLAENSWCAPM